MIIITSEYVIRKEQILKLYFQSTATLAHILSDKVILFSLNKLEPCLLKYFQRYQPVGIYV